MRVRLLLDDDTTAGLDALRSPLDVQPNIEAHRPLWPAACGYHRDA
jgi:hypothetical protein